MMHAICQICEVVFQTGSEFFINYCGHVFCRVCSDSVVICTCGGAAVILKRLYVTSCEDDQDIEVEELMQQSQAKIGGEASLLEDRAVLFRQSLFYQSIFDNLESHLHLMGQMTSDMDSRQAKFQKSFDAKQAQYETLRTLIDEKKEELRSLNESNKSAN